MDDIRKIVKNGYEKGKYAKIFKRNRSRLNKFEQSAMKHLTDSLHVGSKVLDLGCGTGLPYDKYLVNRGYEVTGIDFSKKHISMARKSVPEAKFIEKDFTKLRFKPETFDAVVSFYAIFHVPRAEHGQLFRKVNRLLDKKGIMFIIIGAGESDYYSKKGWAGAPLMMWSGFNPKKEIELITKNGFRVKTIIEEGRDGDQEHHLWILAVKTK